VSQLLAQASGHFGEHPPSAIDGDKSPAESGENSPHSMAHWAFEVRQACCGKAIGEQD
jgi:hypothetical protein